MAILTDALDAFALEAGLAGKPMVCTNVPAAREIGGDDVLIIDSQDDPEQIAQGIISYVADTPIQRLRHRIREQYTWSAIFERDIRPLLSGGAQA